MRVRNCAVTLGLLLAVGACSAKEVVVTTPEARGEPVLTAAPAVRGEREVVFPLDAYLPPADYFPQVSRAQAKLEAQCLARFGIVEPGWLTRIPTPETRREMTYLDERIARRYGYRQPADFLPYEDVKARNTKPRSSFRAYKVLNGGIGSYDGMAVPKGGCRGWAHEQIFKHPSLAPENALEFAVQANTKVMADSRFHQARDRWSACMRADGYRYAHPLDASQRTWEGADSSALRKPKPTRAEVKSALADAKCRRESNVYDLWVRLTVAYQHPLITRNAATLAMSTKVLTRWYENAKAVTG